MLALNKLKHDLDITMSINK